ncbi:hypothetical protein G7Y89_g10855 [Cudoniella acicularis]|uniref:Uncharacterized protein n=1 Tax=Cudoniella acicularis TaxID=354080 RepID=A0A8H4VYT7_9HELO|nr:hypothetical protein G7Y89_g10855 [Cudoniella acicularis]
MTSINNRYVLREILDYIDDMYKKYYLGATPYDLRTLKYFTELLVTIAKACVASNMNSFYHSAIGLKGTRIRLEYLIFETTIGLPLIFNPIIFLLVIALASKVFNKSYRHHHSIDMPDIGRKRRLDSESQSSTLRVKSDADKPKPKRSRLKGKRYSPALGSKLNRDGCYGIKLEPLNDTLYHDFMNYSVMDLEPSSTDLTTPATTPCSSSCDDLPSNVTGTTSIQDAITAASLREPSHPPAAICSSPSHTSSSALRRPRSPTGSTYGVTEAEAEGSLEGELAYPLDSGHSLRDVVITQEAPRAIINDSGNEGDPLALGKTLLRIERDVPSGDLSISDFPRCDASQGILTAPARDASSSDLLRTLTLNTRNNITGNNREPIADPRSPECLPSRKQSFHEPGPPAVALDDDQCTVERLLGRQDIARGKVNFTDRIAELEAENSRLICEVNKLEDATTAELTLRRDAKEATNQLKAMLDIANLENQYLKKDIQRWTSTAEEFRARAADSH